MANYVSSFPDGATVDALLTAVDTATGSTIHKITRSATFVIAASDSPAASIAQADYVCDGTADQVQVQAAIDALPSTGGKILLCTGNYAFSGSIVSSVDNVVLSGEGMYNTHIVSTASYADTGVVCNIYGTIGTPLNSWAIYDISFDLSSISRGVDTVDRRAISFNYVENINIDHVKILSSPCTVVYVSNGVNHVTLTNNHLDETGQGAEFGYGFLVQRSDFVLTPVKHIIINNNYINATGWNSIAIYGNSEQATITNNVIVSMATSHSGIAVSSGKYISIANNIVSDTVYANEAGIEVEATTAHASSPYLSSQISITGNVLFNNYVGIDLREASGDLVNRCVSIAGNVIDLSIHKGIRIFNSHGVAATSNVITNSAGHGILCEASSHALISNNNIEEVGSCGILILDSSFNTISGNYVAYCSRTTTNSSSSIDLRGTASDNFVFGNRVLAATTGNVAAAAVVIATAVTNERNIISNNDIRGTYGTATITNWGANTIIKYNNGYVTEKTGTATITASGTTVDVTHGMAKTPTRVIITPTTDTDGKDCWVSAKAATTFTITIDSASAGNISFDWQAVV